MILRFKIHLFWLIFSTFCLPLKAWDSQQTKSTHFTAYINQNDINGNIKVSTTNNTINFNLRGCLSLNKNNHCGHNFTRIKIYSNPIPINGFWRNPSKKCDPTLLGSLTAIIYVEKPGQSIDFQKSLVYNDEISAVQDLRTLVISDEKENPIICSTLLVHDDEHDVHGNYVMRRHNANYYVKVEILKSYM